MIEVFEDIFLDSAENVFEDVFSYEPPEFGTPDDGDVWKAEARHLVWSAGGNMATLLQTIRAVNEITGHPSANRTYGVDLTDRIPADVTVSSATLSQENDGI